MLRVLRMARDQGITAFGSPTATSPSDTNPQLRFQATLHELGALALYFLTGGDPAEAPDSAPDASSAAATAGN
jgi:hypothetical protein